MLEKDKGINMDLLKVKCKKTLIMEICDSDIWENEEQTLIDAEQLDISFYKNKEYILVKSGKNRYVTIGENNDLHYLNYNEIIEYFKVIKKGFVYGN